MPLLRLFTLACLLLALGACEPASEPAATATNAGNAIDTAEIYLNAASDEFAASFRMRNSEIRSDIIAELTKRNIPHKLNADGSIGYRAIDGEAIDAVYYWAVGLYAARN